ncbi:MAG: pentapeptide repeat-containing protein [Pseudomonadota bacterium]|nr:pentapeptide repeat-containing protein [Pseudomonadota bacterium]
MWLKSGSGGKSCTDCDLSGAVLENVSYAGGNLSRANLTGAYLSGNLHGAKLRSANLTNLNAADYCSAGTYPIDFGAADFTGATLSSADFECVDLRGAKLNNVTSSAAFYFIRSDLTGATVTGTGAANAVYSDSICPDGQPSTSDNRCP